MARLISIMILGLICVSLIASCAPAASYSRSQDTIKSGGIVSADELRVAEYMGYYKQSFPAPKNTTLGLDLRLGNPQIPAEGGPAWLQIGVQARTEDTDAVAPLNIAIVIDKSGSMDAVNKMPFLKESLRAFLRSLAPSDIVALVAFDDAAIVLKPAAKVGDGAWIESAIDRLRPGGGTGLHAGMMAGFKEVDRNYDVRRNNRVLLLTDGEANIGVTDPERIAADARAYNDRGIYLSTIGLGRGEYNDKLLSQLAAQGKGSYYFVDSAAEMDRIFRREFSSLVQKAASDVSIVVRPEPGVRIESITGFDGRPPADDVQVKVRDMGTGESQVVLVRLSVEPGTVGLRPLAAVELRYQDLFSQRQSSERGAIAADASRLNGYDPARDNEVLRNVTIQRTAEGIKEIDRLYKSQRYNDAWELAYGLEQDLRSVARIANDQQLVKDADTMRQYQDTLAKWVEKQTGRPPRSQSSRTEERPSRDRSVSPNTIPTVEIK